MIPVSPRAGGCITRALALLLWIATSAGAEPSAVTVVVLGRADRPLEDVRVLRRNSDATWTTVGRTNASGELSLPSAPIDGSWVIGTWFEGIEPGEWNAPRPVEVTSPRVEIRLECGTRLVAQIVDAETGAA